MGHTQIVMNLVDFGMNLQEAGDAPRWDHSGGASPMGRVTEDTGLIRIESGIPYATVRGLIDKGHHVGYARGVFGGYQQSCGMKKTKSITEPQKAEKTARQQAFKL